MAKTLKENEILKNLNLLSDWLRVKHPGERFDESDESLAKRSKRRG